MPLPKPPAVSGTGRLGCSQPVSSLNHSSFLSQPFLFLPQHLAGASRPWASWLCLPGISRSPHIPMPCLEAAPSLLQGLPFYSRLLPRPPGETGLPTGKISVMHKCPEADKCPSTGPACAAGLPFLLTSLLCPGWCEGVGGGHGVGAV